MIYSNNKKLLYSNVNKKEVNYVCPFHCADFPESLAIATEADLAIGTVDDIQKLHIRTIPLHEQPRRICHQPQSKAFAVITMVFEQAVSDDDLTAAPETYFVRIYDDQTFEVLDSVELEKYETGVSILSTSFDEGSETAYFVIGTAFARPTEPEPTDGRIIVYKLTEDKKLLKVNDIKVKGAVYTMAEFNGKLLGGINSKIQLYTWNKRADGVHELSRECGHHGHILALHIATRGDYIIVGDLMKSMSLLMYKPVRAACPLRPPSTRTICASSTSARPFLHALRVRSDGLDEQRRSFGCRGVLRSRRSPRTSTRTG